MSGRVVHVGCLVAFALIVVAAAGAQVEPDAYQETSNDRYAYPVSIGAGYAQLSPAGDIEHDETPTVNDISARVRVPLPFLPVLQPFVIGGMVSFNSPMQDDPTILNAVFQDGYGYPAYNRDETWDHDNYFLGLGVGYAHRINKEFEAGAELFAALKQSYFPQRVVTDTGEWYPVGELGLTVGLNGKISLNPSYNLTIDVVPAFRYDRTFGNLPDFDGLYFGLGFAAHYRFGDDPDAPVAEVRALRIAADELPPVFAAMQKVYVDQPVAYVALTNEEDTEVTDVSVSFFQASYMDTPTPCAEIESITPGESVDVPLHASFNEEVFETVDVVPLTGEIIVSYNYRGNPADQSHPVTFDLQDRNSLTWDDDAKVGAFITPRDSAVLNYASFVASESRDANTDYLPDNLEIAMQVYHALAALELAYQADPSSPFAAVQGDAVFVDSVSLPRETLRRGTGDCDDLTVLYNTMLESVGIPTGIVTIPGHIYSAVDTGLGPRDWPRVNPDRTMTMVDGDNLWVLVEITLIGQAGFVDAWQTGIEQWKAYDNDVPARNFIPTAVCQEVYGPVGLRETDIGLQYGNPEEFLVGFRQDRGRLANVILEPVREQAADRNRPRTWNHLGAIAAQLREFSAADEAFSRAAQMDSGYLSPRVNLGALRYLQGDIEGALEVLRDAETIVTLGNASPDTALAVYINLGKTLQAADRHDEAAEYYDLAAGISPEETARHRFAAQTSSSGGRASSAADIPAAVFVDEGAGE